MFASKGYEIAWIPDNPIVPIFEKFLLRRPNEDHAAGSELPQLH